MSADLPETLSSFIESSIPTLDAAEVLLFLADRRERGWEPTEIAAGMKGGELALQAVREYLALFKVRGIVEEKEGSFHYAPSSPELESGVAALAHAYNERPVTLIRTIYRLADTRIQSFADSFKLRKDK